MEKSKVREILEVELSKYAPFENWHGITKENINKFLVKPTAVTVDPDDLETSKRKMWVVLQTENDIKKGYSIAYDFWQQHWAVIAYTGKANEFVQITAEPTLAEALGSM